MDNQTAGMTPDEFTAFVTLHGRLTGDEDLTNAAGSHRLTFADGTQIEAIANSDGSVNVTKYDKLVKPPAGQSQGPRTVKFNGNLYTEDSQGNMHLSMTGDAANVPRYDQPMPGTGTAGGVKDPNASLDAYTTGGAYTPSTPDLTIGQYSAQTERQREQDYQTHQDAADKIAAARLALDQKNAELKQGQDAITNAYNNNQLTLDQAKTAADLLYKQADIELRAQIGQQTFGASMASEQMKRLPAGTLAAFGPTAAAATQGRFVAPNIPQDTRDPTQIALNAIAQLKAGQGPTPAQTAFAAATPQSIGLTLPSAGGIGGTQTNLTQPVQPPVAPPYFPRPGATTGPF